MLDFGFELLFIASNFILFGSNHHKWFEPFLFFVGGSSSTFLLRSVLEFVLVFFYLLLVGLQLGLRHLIVGDLVRIYEAVWIVLF
jgi:hypothetical protein